MRSVKFIKRLVIEDAMVGDYDRDLRYRFHPGMGNMTPLDGSEVLLTEYAVEHKIVPINKFCRRTSENTVEDTYIALSEEVCDYLQLPIDLFKEKNEQLEAEVRVLKAQYEVLMDICKAQQDNIEVLHMIDFLGAGQERNQMLK